MTARGSDEYGGHSDTPGIMDDNSDTGDGDNTGEDIIGEEDDQRCEDDEGDYDSGDHSAQDIIAGGGNDKSDDDTEQEWIIDDGHSDTRSGPPPLVPASAVAMTGIQHIFASEETTSTYLLDKFGVGKGVLWAI